MRPDLSFPYPIGTAVIVTRDNGDEVHTRTRSEAARVGGMPVIWLDGFSGCYLLSRVRLDRERNAADVA